MKHVVHISNDYFPIASGINTHLQNLPSEIKKQGFNITLLVTVESEDKIHKIETNEKDGVRIVKVYHADAFSNFDKLFHITQSVKRGLVWISENIDSIDILHQHDERATRLGATIFAKKKDIPIIWTNHSAGFFKKKWNPIRFLSHFSTLVPDGIISVHQLVHKEFQHHTRYQKIPCCYIPNGVDLNQLDRKSTNTTQNKSTVLFPQRMIHIKGPEILAKAALELFKSNPDINISYLFAGSDSASNIEDKTIGIVKEILKPLLNEGLVTFAGNPSYGNMADLYRSADIVVLPLLVESENLSVFEAWASECALIVSEQLAQNNYVKDGKNCLVVANNNYSQLKEAILKLVDDVDFKRKLIRRGKETVEKQFSWEMIAKETAKFYELIIDRYNE